MSGIEDARLEPCHELGELLSSFEKGHLQAAFVPVGTLPYITSEYEIVAQATLGSCQTGLKSKLVVRSDEQEAQAATASLRLGRINQYCTTSYWAPMISLMHEPTLGTRLEFIDTNGFDDLLESVIDGRSQGAMVWDAVLRKHPDWEGQLHVRFDRKELPAPIVIVRGRANLEARAKLSPLLQSNGQDRDNLYFNGLVEPDRQQIAAFKEEMSAARKYFTV